MVVLIVCFAFAGEMKTVCSVKCIHCLFARVIVTKLSNTHFKKVVNVSIRLKINDV
jgi:hypothetical protein